MAFFSYLFMAIFSRHYFGYFNLSVFGYFRMALTSGRRCMDAGSQFDCADIRENKAAAKKIGEDACARIIIGRRVLYSVSKVQKYLETIAA